MTDRPLDVEAIRARHAAATDGHWFMDTAGRFCGDPNMVVGDRGDHADAIATMRFGEGDQAEADEAFVLGAHDDITALLAEVDRLRGEVIRLSRERDCTQAKYDGERQRYDRLFAKIRVLEDLVPDHAVDEGAADILMTVSDILNGGALPTTGDDQ